MANFPSTSIMNLFKNIVYDKTENPNKMLDIWDAYVISPFFKTQLAYFENYTITANDTWVSLALRFYGDARLWWVIPLFNDIEDPFTVMDRNIFSEIKQVKILKSEHLSSLLLQARQQKIINDRIKDNE